MKNGCEDLGNGVELFFSERQAIRNIVGRESISVQEEFLAVLGLLEYRMNVSGQGYQWKYWLVKNSPPMFPLKAEKRLWVLYYGEKMLALD